MLINERFAELMAKGQAGRLTPAEREELALLLNQPVLDPNQAPGFVSKHNFTQSDLPVKLSEVDWFSLCGEPLSWDLTMGIEQVGSWSEAVESCSDGAWEDTELEAQNQLTQWLHQHDRKNYQDWNKLVAEHKAVVLNRLTEEKWIPYQQSHALDDVIVQCAQWDVLGALMENSYLSSEHRCFFFLELLSVYEAGHLPCGWRGEWPQGKLVVY